MPRPVLVVFILCVGIQLSADTGDDIRILFTSNSNGKYENCQCPDYPHGALERRAAFIGQYKEQYPKTIVLDNGDNFFHGMRAAEKTLVTRIFSLIPYDIINVGDQDLAFGTEAYRALPEIIEAGDPPVSLWRDKTEISVLTVTHPTTIRFYPEDTFAEVPFNDPIRRIEQWVSDIAGEKVLSVLLSHSGYEWDVEYAHRFPEITLIIGGHSQTLIDTVNKINGVAVQQAGGNAEYIGEIICTLVGDHFRIKSYQLYPMDEAVGAHPEVDKWLDEYHQTYQRK